MPTKNNNPKGIMFILLAMMVFAVQDSIMKYIYSFVNLYEVYLVRTLVSLIIILLFLKITKDNYKAYESSHKINFIQRYAIINIVHCCILKRNNKHSNEDKKNAFWIIICHR